MRSAHRLAVLLGALAALASAPVLSAQEVRDGLFITVPNPIRDEAVSQIKQKIKDAVERKKRPISIVVFDFNPSGLPAGSSNFGSCSDLADYIRSLALGGIHPVRPTTVAFVHNQVSRHTVLPVLACSQIVMSRELDENKNFKARLGDVTKGLPDTPTATARDAYRRQAEQYASPDLVLRMLDPNLAIKTVKLEQGVRYATAERIEKWRADKKGAFTVLSEIPSGLEPGRGSFDPETARALGLASAHYDTRAELAAALKLPRQSLSEDWLVGRQVVPWRLDVTGAIDKARLDSLLRRVNTAVGRGANLIILQLEASGGDTTHVATLANHLRQLRSRGGSVPVKTVAYVPPGRTLGAATFLAVACDEIVMGTDSVLADFNYLRDEPPEALHVRQEMLKPLVSEQGYPETLFRATLEPAQVLYRVRAKADAADERLITEQAYNEDQALPNPQWSALGRLAPAQDDRLLKIPAPIAKEWRIAQAVGIDTNDALYGFYDLDSDQVRVSRDDLLDRVAEFFRDPIVIFVLIMLGIVGLILELKLPGTTFPGAVAAICFVLFFWAHSFVGEFTLLAVLLFLLGLILIGVEIFIVPGLGFSGIAGVGLVIISLALVTLERWPETSQDWLGLGSTVSLFAMSLAAALVAAFVVASFLPSIPFANRLLLPPPGEEEPAELSAHGGVAPALLGAIGVAVTTLRPAGKAQFGDEFLDVVAEGDYVNPGSRVQVIEIEGYRIVVKEV